MITFLLTLFCLVILAIPTFNYYLLKKCELKIDTTYKSKYSGVNFKELYRYENESLLVRLDTNSRTIVSHKELEKNFTRI